jgi:hypothetical protein
MRFLAVALLTTIGFTPVKADTFIVSGIFAAEAGLPSNTLSGTIDINGGVIAGVSLSVPGMSSAVTVLAQSRVDSTICLAVSTVNGTCLQVTDVWEIRVSNGNFVNNPAGENLIDLTFTAFPGRSLIGFQQGFISNGFAANTRYDPITTDSTVTYFGLALGGTICPLDGCAPFPTQVILVGPVTAPSPVIGAGLPGLLLAGGLLGWRRRCRR